MGEAIIRGPSDDPEIHDQDPLFESIKTQEKNLDPEEMWVPCGRGIKKTGLVCEGLKQRY